MRGGPLHICFHTDFLLGLFDPEDGGDKFLRNVCQSTFNGLQVIMSQKTEFSIAVADITSKATLAV
jgi:hypothetical protein